MQPSCYTPDMKQYFTALGALVGLLALVAVAYLFYPAPAKAPLTVASSAKLEEHAKNYDIVAYYATTTPFAAANPAADTAAAARMKALIDSTVAEFKTATGPTWKSTLEVHYMVSSSTRTISYIYTTYEYTGGAHNNTFFTTFTFDRTTGAPLSLSDLFAPGTDYLGALSQIARATLPAQLGALANAQMLSAGTAPDAKNFSAFFIDNSTLDILFAPYAVAPYAAGPQTLQIPLANLTNVLKPEYR